MAAYESTNHKQVLQLVTSSRHATFQRKLKENSHVVRATSNRWYREAYGTYARRRPVLDGAPAIRRPSEPAVRWRRPAAACPCSWRLARQDVGVHYGINIAVDERGWAVRGWACRCRPQQVVAMFMGREAARI